MWLNCPSLSYHYVYRRQASQQVVRSQQGRHKRVPDNGGWSWPNKSQALRAHGLKAVWVMHVISTVGCRGVSGCSASVAALRPPRRRWQRACSTWSPHGVQKGLDPVGGSLGEITEQHSSVSAQRAKTAVSHHRLHRLTVCTWEEDDVKWLMRLFRIQSWPIYVVFSSRWQHCRCVGLIFVDGNNIKW